MDCVNFTINGKKYRAGRESSATTSLNEFIRRSAGLRGTKYMCLEGGCGTCVVFVRTLQPLSNEINTFSVNTCLINVLSCDGWDITTVEGIGNRADGYNVIQTRLNHYFGSQCGYCSPGFVMSMYSLTQKCEGHLSAEEIEKSFGSNLCRCTGYRPILEAFKSLADKPDPKLLMKIKDIEDVGSATCPKNGKECNLRKSCHSKMKDWCVINADVNNPHPALPKKIPLLDGKLWYSVASIRSIFDILDEHGNDSYMLIAGNTSKGARPIKCYPKILIDINNISELRNHYLDVNLVLGANMTLTETMELFADLSKSDEDFWYLNILRDHLEQVAHIPVRNVGTLAGNLFLKHEHPDFQSDVFILFECVGAFVTLVDRKKKKTEISLKEFMKINVVGKVMTEIKLPPLSRNYELVTYKIAAKEQNAHAQVNSAFLLKFNPSTQNIEKASIVYGGISPSFIHAFKTEKYLIDKYIFHNNVLQNGLRCLENEINPVINPPEPSPEYRRMTAVGLFYKCVLKLCPRDILKQTYKSGSTIVDRPPVSQSYQEYDTDKNEFPITQPLLKKEGLLQCSGEAVYSDDDSTDCNEVFAALVLAKVNQGEIESINTTEALKVDGVVAVLTSADIPGRNSIVTPDGVFIFKDEVFLVSDKIEYYNQPVAVVAAKTQALADSATYFVKINYKNKSQTIPVLTIKDARKAPVKENRITRYDPITSTDRGINIKKVIKGHYYSPQQYHHMMELHTTIAKPVDDTLEIWTASQYLNGVQRTVAKLLTLPENKVMVMNRRCGGGFGSKMYRANLATCAAALVSHHLNKPCRIALHLRDIMRATGKRPDSMVEYEVAVDENGKVQYLIGSLYLNYGNSLNENESAVAVSGFKNCYDFSRWNLEVYSAKTDTPGNCFMRGPGHFQAVGAIEHIMDHISFELNLDPIRVRIANYRNEDNPLIEILPLFLQKSEYDERQTKIKAFNEHNRWKKRAISLVNMAFEVDYFGNYLALVSVYRGDGSVTINTGGIEMGQGIYTRLCQVAANELRIPVEKVAVVFASTYASPNNFVSGGSITTECSAYAVIRSCQQINERLAPVRAAMPKASWEQIVEEADKRGILLQANYLAPANDPGLRSYSAFGFAAVEVELDVLTGKHWIVRADVFEDAGKSINPALDLGQVEGAFVQALSGWTIEDLVYDEHDGELLTDRTWNYHIVGAKDIPHDFRVYLRRHAPNPLGVLGSKAVGEPPITMGCVIVHALRSAIRESKLDSGYSSDLFVELDVPVTPESALLAADPKIEEYILY